jgi:hypothetical protein
MKGLAVFFLLFGSLLFSGSGSVLAQSATLSSDGNELVSASAYPNPATEFIHFECKLNVSVLSPKIVVNNVLGAAVAEIEIDTTDPKAKIAVSDWKSGVYFYTLFSGGKALYTRKFVVKH